MFLFTVIFIYKGWFIVWEDDYEGDTPKVSCILKDPKGKVYLGECVDVTEGGLILRVDRDWVKEGTFPDEYLDTRFLEEEMGFKIYLLSANQENVELH